jgi:hypothetical protein
MESIKYHALVVRRLPFLALEKLRLGLSKRKRKKPMIVITITASSTYLAGPWYFFPKRLAFPSLSALSTSGVPFSSSSGRTILESLLMTS